MNGRNNEGRKKVLAVASSGGHWTQLLRVTPAFTSDEIVFVTVDPERDTPEVLKAYVSSFGPDVVGLRGSLEQTAAVAKEFKVFYAKVPGKVPGSYSMDHSAASFVFDPAGKVRLYVPYGGDPKVLAADLQQLAAVAG